LKNILVVFGTRPEVIKLAPVIHKLKNEKSFNTFICSTGQHREMLKQVLDIFSLEIDEDLDLMQPNQSLFDITINSLNKLNYTLEKYSPDLVIVQGDTTTAFVTALAAFYKKIKVAHVEAGLRSYDNYHPYPEEANRRFISVVSNFNFAPTEYSRRNLLNEGFEHKSVFVTGNTVVDALLSIKEILIDKKIQERINVQITKLLGVNILTQPFILITLHRREKFGKEIRALLKIIKEIAEKYSEYNFVYPVHLNPNVAEPVKEILGNNKNIFLTEPLDYVSFLYLMSKCKFIMSDSGGVQEECFVFSKPIIVLRYVTERNEAVKAGYAFITGSDRKKILSHFDEIDSKINKGYNFFPKENPFGDGKASERIVNILKENL